MPGLVTDAEGFAPSVLGGPPPAGSVNAAQAARRLAALNVPTGHYAAGAARHHRAADRRGRRFGNHADLRVGSRDVNAGMSVAGPNIAPGAAVASVSGDSVTLPTSAPVLNDVPAGSEIVFTPPYSAGLASLVQAWLSFPTDARRCDQQRLLSARRRRQQVLAGCGKRAARRIPQPGAVRADARRDAAGAFHRRARRRDRRERNCCGSPTTVTALAAVTGQQWTDFFQANPTWLPSFTQPGDTTARIAAFIRAVQKFFAVASGGPSSPFVLATSAATAAGGNGSAFSADDGDRRGHVGQRRRHRARHHRRDLAPPPPAAATSVTLNQPVTGAGVPAHANITFSLAVSAGPRAAPPALPGLAEDWLAAWPVGLWRLHARRRLRPAATAGRRGDAFSPAIRAPRPGSSTHWSRSTRSTRSCNRCRRRHGCRHRMPAAYTFSVVEALYARGFTSAARITELSAADFQQALAGTVAYDLAAAIYASAAAIAPPAPPATAGRRLPAGEPGRGADQLHSVALLARRSAPSPI